MVRNILIPRGFKPNWPVKPIKDNRLAARLRILTRELIDMQEMIKSGDDLEPAGPVVMVRTARTLQMELQQVVNYYKQYV